MQKQLSKADRAMIEKLAGEGKSQRQIAAVVGCAKSSVWSALNRSGRVHGVATPNDAPPVSGATGGFRLRGKQVLATKPTNIWPARLNSLAVDMGYMPETLAEQWACSVNTVRDHARAHKAVRWVLDDDGQYKECIVNPKTPGGK